MPGSMNVSQLGGVATQLGNADGVSAANILELLLAALSSGGPVLASTLPSQLNGDRLKTWQAKKSASVAITSTTVGDNNLACASGILKLVYPGCKIQLSGSGVTEDVIVATTYVPSTTVTSVALQSPVVNTGQTTAKFDTYDPKGPGGAAALSHGVLPLVLMYEDISQRGSLYNMGSGSFDGQSSVLFPEFCMGAVNGASTDRWHTNMDNITLINASNVSTTQTGTDQVNYNGRGIKVWWNITTFGAALTLHIDYKDPVSGQYLQDVLTSAAISANTFTQYTIYPGVTTTTNVALNDAVPRGWRVRVTGASGSTFTVAASVIM